MGGRTNTQGTRPVRKLAQEHRESGPNRPTDNCTPKRRKLALRSIFGIFAYRPNQIFFLKITNSKDALVQMADLGCICSATTVHPTSHSGHGCALPSQVWNGKDSSVCVVSSATTRASGGTGWSSHCLPHKRACISGKRLSSSSPVLHQVQSRYSRWAKKDTICLLAGKACMVPRFEYPLA